MSARPKSQLVLWGMLLTLCLFGNSVNAQNIKVLEYDGSSSLQQGPQTSIRYQRQFYLMTPAEVQASGIDPASIINSIGFSLAVPQDSVVDADFKVYLQNTSDIAARVDTNWVYDTLQTSQFSPSNLIRGTYEWQVRSDCGSEADFSSSASFSLEPTNCYQPDFLSESSITDSSVMLSWRAIDTTGSPDFQIQYKEVNTEVWQTTSTSSSPFLLEGLQPDVGYIWEVRTDCGSEISSKSSGSFRTSPVIVCEDVTGLAVDTSSITDTTVVLSWAPTAETQRYDLQFRRVGLQDWDRTIVFATTTTLNFGLAPGTTYEWQVRAVCDTLLSVGEYASGPDFRTSGTSPCFGPVDLQTGDYTDTSAVFKWSDVADVSQYIIRYRLKNTISWANAIDGMLLVHDDSISIPTAIGPYFIDFVGDTTFTYDGQGIYVAWEYRDTSASLQGRNTYLSTKGDTLLAFASLIDTFLTEQQATIYGTDFRAETWLGSTSLADSVSIDAVYTYGQNAIPYSNPAVISGLLKNLSATTRTLTASVSVRDAMSGVEKYTSSKDTTLAAGEEAIVTFSDWAPDLTVADSIILEVLPVSGENVLNNNRTGYLQEVNKTYISYADDSDPLAGTSAGFGTGSGLILSRHTMSGCGTINSVRVHLDRSAEGDTVYAVVVDTSGTIIAQSEELLVTMDNTGSYYDFFLNSPIGIFDQDYFIGLAQTTDSIPRWPVSIQWDGRVVRTNTFYSADLNGSNITPASFAGRPMITGEIIPSVASPYIYGDDVICDGGDIELSVGSVDLRYANQVLDFSSQLFTTSYSARKTLGASNASDGGDLSSEVWLSSTPDESREYLELTFPDANAINFIRIFEKENPGAIDTVYVLNPGSNSYEVVYAQPVDTIADPSRMLDIDFTMTGFDVDQIRIAINSPAVTGFNGIDAVGIGVKETVGNYNTYLWSNGGSTDSTLTVSTAGNYSVTVTQGECAGVATYTVGSSDTITPIISITGNLTFCQGGSVTLRSDITEGITWSTGATTDSITVTSQGSYTVSYDNGCFTTTSDAVGVTVNSNPTPSITGSVICQGSTSILDPGPDYVQYMWSTGQSSQTIEVSTSGFFSVTVVDTSGCSGTGFAVTSVQPLPNPNITGDLDFCEGSSTDLNAGGGYSSYLWSTGETSSTITVDSGDQYIVTVTDAFGCVGSDDVSATETPAPIPFISGSLSLCVGTSTQIDAGGGYSSYLWSNGATAQAILVDTPATFTVTVTDFNGCTGSASATTTTDGVVPEPPGPITGPQDLCEGDSLIYTIDPVANAAFYVWMPPEGVTIIDGQGSTSILISVADTFTTGNLVVAASNSCGQSPSIEPTFITLLGVPVAPGEITGPVGSLCDLGALTFSIDDLPGLQTYNWTVPAGATILSGQGTTDITVAFGFESGDVCVSATSGCGTGLITCFAFEVPESSLHTVVTNKDSGAGSLREAISNVCSNDTIRFNPVLIGDTITITGSAISIDRNLVVLGLGTSDLAVSGEDNSPVFDVSAARTLKLNDITLLRGFDSTSGGAFFNRGTTYLHNVHMIGNYSGADMRAFTNDGRVVVSGVVSVEQ